MVVFFELASAIPAVGESTLGTLRGGNCGAEEGSVSETTWSGSALGVVSAASPPSASLPIEEPTPESTEFECLCFGFVDRAGST